MTMKVWHIAMMLFGLYLDTNMWNMVMPKLLSLPHLTYVQMFMGSLAVRFITSSDYTSPILWNKYLSDMTTEEKTEAIKDRYLSYVTGQSIFFIIVWVIVTVCL